MRDFFLMSLTVVFVCLVTVLAGTGDVMLNPISQPPRELRGVKGIDDCLKIELAKKDQKQRLLNGCLKESIARMERRRVDLSSTDALNDREP